MMKFIAVLVFIVVLLALGALMGTFVAWGYNVALAEPFGWPTLLWWQGWIILILSGLLLRGLRSK
jgi:uncharacterized membrane protein YciS (DUF1049 family)